MKSHSNTSSPQRNHDTASSPLETLVQDLCLEEGITMRKVKNDMASFQLALQFPNPQSTITIYQPKNKGDMVVVGTVIEVVDEHKEKMKQLSTEKRETFIWDLKLLLARGTTEFELQHPHDILEFVRIHKFIFEDGFSKHVFMNTLFEINRVKLLVIWFIQKNLGSSPASKQEKGPMNDTFIYR
ncbi:MAG: DUF2299 family protein [Theionarchaea archaeon]|nr:DUF2299 family protein [Theionarchaea archaeon]